MLSMQARLLTFMVRLIGVKRIFAGAEHVHKSIAKDRRKGAAQPSSQFEKRHVVEKRQVAGYTVYTIRPRKEATRHHLLYLHGGGYVLSIMEPHWNLIGTLVDRLGCTVTLPFYPLAPEKNARDVWGMLMPLYRDLIAEVGAENLTVMGDSAGGNLVLSLAMQARDAALPQPWRLVMLSPNLDITFSNPRLHELDPVDPIISIRGMPEIARLYRGEIPPSDPIVSPIFGSLHGLAPMAIFTGTREIMNADAHSLKEKGEKEGVPLAWFEYPGMLHVWPLFPIPEAGRAIDQIVQFIDPDRGAIAGG